MLARTMCGRRSDAATRKAANARWKAPCELSSAGEQCCVISTRKRRGSGVACARSRASAAKGALPSGPRRPCMSFETVATRRLECCWPSWSRGSAMQRSAVCRISRCFRQPSLSNTKKPASDTADAACCQAFGSLDQSQGIAPLPTRLAISPSTETRWRSMAFCASLASSAAASWSPPFREPLPPRRVAPSVEAFFSTRSAAQRKKKTATFEAVFASCASLDNLFCSFCLAWVFFKRAASPTKRRAASAKRSTIRG
mmetsp:Transcript_56373/g.121466  ORF Transcript_56373/g.121466 Transcript_56373/m.121466 type:complete len:256 (+) Transcript_56373:3808-4575(+)